jgi:CheY-like chemotaxis protein
LPLSYLWDPAGQPLPPQVRADFQSPWPPQVQICGQTTEVAPTIAYNRLHGYRTQVNNPGMSKRVLIIDDEPNIVISLEFLMKREGFTVAVARDGEEGLAAIREHRPDLVVLDVMMPKRNGYEVLEAVRADPALASVRILMLTAKGRLAESKKGFELGADAYMPKPFSTRELVDKAKSLLAEDPTQL